MLTTHDNAVDRESCVHDAERLGALSTALGDEFGTVFRIFDGSTGEPLAERASEGWLAGTAWETSASIRAVAADGRPVVARLDHDCFRLVLPVRSADGSSLVAVGELPALARSPQDIHREQQRLEKWL